MKMFSKRLGFAFVLIMYLSALYTTKGYRIANYKESFSKNESASISPDDLNANFEFILNKTQNTFGVEGFDKMPTPVRKSHTFNSFERSNPIRFVKFIIFSRQILYASNTVIQFQKTDISFPFYLFS